MNDRYYVYVYIDPRNFEEFYYGKGTGSRSHAHLQDAGDSVKVKRIQAIQAEGLKPIIRIIARGLTSEEALMVETALIWKLGRNLTNIASGQYVGRFRPPDMLHKRLARFDFENGIYYVNVGEGTHRNWDDCREYGFMTAGGLPRWRDAICGLEVGDVVVAYLKGSGYVGVGVVRSTALPYELYRHKGRPLSDYQFVAPNMGEAASDRDLCQYILGVDWRASVDRDNAKWVSRSGLFSSTHVRASLDAQPATISFVEESFGVDLGALANGGSAWPDETD